MAAASQTFWKGTNVMADSFAPAEAIDIYCRFCRRIAPAQLDRSIAANGKTVDRGSTFEYFCTRCQKTFCFTGTDLVKKATEEAEKAPEPRDYDPKLHYLIGETIYHKKFKEKGKVIGKEIGEPPRILVNFKKKGLKKLVEDA
jgi:hypothetical protein